MRELHRTALVSAILKYGGGIGQAKDEKEMVTK